MTPVKRSGAPPPGERPASEGSSRHHAAGQSQDNAPARRAEVIAGGFAAALAGRRTLHAIIVPCCPHCGFLHQHKSASGQVGRRTGSCGRAYRVVIVGRRKGAA
jgi:hypothetical protein